MINERWRNLEGLRVTFPLKASEHANAPGAEIHGSQLTGLIIHQDYEGTLVVVVDGWTMNGQPLAHHIALRDATIPSLEASWAGNPAG